MDGAFYGLRPASIAMITAAGLKVARIALVNMDAFAEGGGGLGEFFIWKALVLAVALFFVQKKLKWNPVVLIAISAVIGVIFQF